MNFMDMQREGREYVRAHYRPLNCDWCGQMHLPWADYADANFGDAVFSRKAVEVLRDLLEGPGDIYPLKFAHRKPEYLMYLHWTRIDALDMDIPDLACGHVSTPVPFKPGVTLPAIFMVMQENALWVTEDFKRRAEEAGLTGFDFQYVGEIRAGSSL
ncbi:MAG: hypothetical protein ACYDHY_18155 [Acidiferrobacterales bacterium]